MCPESQLGFVQFSVLRLSGSVRCVMGIGHRSRACVRWFLIYLQFQLAWKSSGPGFEVIKILEPHLFISSATSEPRAFLSVLWQSWAHAGSGGIWEEHTLFCGLQLNVIILMIIVIIHSTHFFLALHRVMCSCIHQQHPLSLFLALYKNWDTN